jgi:hypothetical protein
LYVHVLIFSEEGEMPDYNQLQQIHHNAQA